MTAPSGPRGGGGAGLVLLDFMARQRAASRHDFAGWEKHQIHEFTHAEQVAARDDLLARGLATRNFAGGPISISPAGRAHLGAGAARTGGGKD